MLMEENQQGLPKCKCLTSSVKLVLKSGIKIIKLDLLSDAMAFGALRRCQNKEEQSVCKGQLLYESGLGYRCINARDWRQCSETLQDPDRSEFRIPISLKLKYPFLEQYEPRVERREIEITVPENPKPLKDMEFYILGDTLRTKEELEKEISLLGGEIVPEIHKNLAACISNLTVSQAEEKDEQMKKLEDFGIQVVLEDFIDKVKRFENQIVKLIIERNICPWGNDPDLRIGGTMNKLKLPKEDHPRNFSTTEIIHVKGGGVDPRSGLEDEVIVYKNSDNVKYTVTLGGINVQSNTNDYYKLQVLKSKENDSCWLFRSWGKIGTNIGDTKLDPYSDLKNCINKFEALYVSKTENQWNANQFIKFPNKKYPIGIDYGDKMVNELPDSEIKCELTKPIEDLMRLIFNTNMMKQAILALKIDLTIMPLGKLAKDQICKGYKVLEELEELIKNNEPDHSPKYIDATNKFYTFIPHALEKSYPENLLDTREKVESKMEMLKSLSSLTFNYELLNARTGECTNPIDYYYEQLKVDIDILDKDSKDFKLIKSYVKNTHGKTHDWVKLDLEDVFLIKRPGEDERYKPFSDFPNRKLLWHGSRMINYPSILLNGLNVAPPGVQLTGSMFGHGIYFADRVSKSVWYCYTSKENPIGLLLLCEVALGEMEQCYRAKGNERLSEGCNSRVAWGKITPDVSKERKIDGVSAPLGRGISAELPQEPVLNYNEYVVFDKAQVRIKYLVKVRKTELPKLESNSAVARACGAWCKLL